MMGIEAALLLVGGAVEARACWIDFRQGLSGDESWGWWAAGSGFIGTFWAIDQVWWFAAILWAIAAWNAWMWWRRRKRRKRAAALLGAKSKALRDALVRKAREAARPKPVLRPVPGGAR